jgi:hypothetical protein
MGGGVTHGGPRYFVARSSPRMSAFSACARSPRRMPPSPPRMPPLTACALPRTARVRRFVRASRCVIPRSSVVLLPPLAPQRSDCVIWDENPHPCEAALNGAS